ncbi:MAG: zf-HC2 domain-containing protein, partial [Anaerolineae bacterium]|nr:zf-HC2 domain-containing protein [Anaerolineae bacterium]
MRSERGDSDRRQEPHIRITDELLSAYLDGEVTLEERRAVENAVEQDPDVAFRLHSLQHTVSLLSSLPRAPLPRSFMLSEADVTSTRQPFWRRWGRARLSLYLRGATALAATLLLVLLIGDFWLIGRPSSAPAPILMGQGSAGQPAAAAQPPGDLAMKKAAPEVLPSNRSAPSRPSTKEAVLSAAAPRALSIEVGRTTPEAPPHQGAGEETVPAEKALIAPATEATPVARVSPAREQTPLRVPQSRAPEVTAAIEGQPSAAAFAASGEITMTAQARPSAPPPSPTGTPMPPAEVAHTLVQSQPTPTPTATPTATITPIPVAQVSGRAA